MGNLSQFHEEESLTVKAIYDYWKKKGDSEPIRGYLGASIIGHECDRYLWYMFRGCVKREFEGRMYRLFNRGHREEAVFVEDLKAIGCEVHDVDENGNQFELSAIGGHFKAHMDGCALGVPEAPKTWHVLEFKTFGGTEDNSKDYEKLAVLGVAKAKPMHYGQMMIEMHLAKIERALYMAVKKATDELYCERVRYSPAEGKAILARAERIIKITQPCERMASRSDDFRCKWCDARDLCWGCESSSLPLPEITCKTCCHSTPEMDGDGRWSCALGLKMEAGCKKHLIIPGLMIGLEVSDAGEDFIKFKCRSGAEFVHGNCAGQWTTEELSKMSLRFLADKSVLMVKDVFGGKVEFFFSRQESLVDQYPHEDTRLVWHGPYNSEKIANVLRDAMGVADVGTPTRQEETEKHQAYEFGWKFLLVHYKADHYAAIWEGVE